MHFLETEEAPPGPLPLRSDASTGCQATGPGLSTSHAPSSAAAPPSPAECRDAARPLFSSAAVHASPPSPSLLASVSDSAEREAGAEAQAPPGRPPSLGFRGAEPPSPAASAAGHTSGAVHFASGSQQESQSSSPEARPPALLVSSRLVLEPCGADAPRRTPQHALDASGGPGDSSGSPPGRAGGRGGRGGKDDEVPVPVSPSQVRAAGVSRVSPRIVGVYSSGNESGLAAKKRGNRPPDEGGALTKATLVYGEEGARRRQDREGDKDASSQDGFRMLGAAPRPGPSVATHLLAAPSALPATEATAMSVPSGGAVGNREPLCYEKRLAERAAASEDARRETPGAEKASPSLEVGELRPAVPETFRLMPVVGDRATATGARKRKKKKVGFRRRSGDGAERPEKPPVGKGGSLFLHPALGDDSEGDSRNADDEESPTSLCSPECCGFFWGQRWHVMQGCLWGWGFTNRPREGVRYYLSEIFAALIIALTQVPEAASFAMMANLPPAIGVHSAWIIGLFACGLGGRPGMINGVTGSFAATIGAYVARTCTQSSCVYEGVETLVASVFVAGAILLAFAYSRLACLVQLIPASVMIGFCNGIAIIIFLAQLQIFKDPATAEYITGARAGWMAGECVLAAVVMEGWRKVPFVGKLLPGSLISMVAAGLMEFLLARMLFDTKTPTIGEVAELTANSALPSPFFADSRWDFSNNVEVHKALMQGLILAVVAILETLMTVEVVDIYAAQAALPPEPAEPAAGRRREAFLKRLLPRSRDPSGPAQTPPAESRPRGFFSPASSGDKLGVYNVIGELANREGDEGDERGDGGTKASSRSNWSKRRESERGLGECGEGIPIGFDAKPMRRGVSSENTSRGSGSVSPPASLRTETESPVAHAGERRFLGRDAETPEANARRLPSSGSAPRPGRGPVSASTLLGEAEEREASSPSRRASPPGEGVDLPSFSSSRVATAAQPRRAGETAHRARTHSVEAPWSDKSGDEARREDEDTRDAVAVQIGQDSGATRGQCSVSSLLLREDEATRQLGEISRELRGPSAARLGEAAFGRPRRTNGGTNESDAGGDQAEVGQVDAAFDGNGEERRGAASCVGGAVGGAEKRETSGVVPNETQESRGGRRKAAVKGDGDQQLWAAGIANVVCAFFGGMGGGAMIGLSVMNLRSGGKGKESGLLQAVFVFVLIAAAYKVLNFLPIAALAGIMFCVAFHTFKWFSLPMVVASFLPETLRSLHPCLVQKISRADAIIVVTVTICCYYEVQGPLCFSTAHKFESAFNYDEDPPTVMCMLSGNTRLFDYSAMASLDAVSRGYMRRGKTLHFKGMSHGCLNMMAKANHLMQHMDYELIELDVPPIHHLVEVHPDDDRESAFAESLFAPSHPTSRASFSRRGHQSSLASRALDSFPRHNSSSLSRVRTGAARLQPSAEASETRSERRRDQERLGETYTSITDEESQKDAYKRQGVSDASRRTACETTAGPSLSLTQTVCVGELGDSEEARPEPGGKPRQRRSAAERREDSDRDEEIEGEKKRGIEK
ncbi:putative sulfate transporter [Neospora caninum Liverpool]|uniref:Putative sulfate transporter n=1 Tax=Neospora caninum (strain Liverpool) TaxID=572307 RepID=F0VII6_NEOCL|nr:putative sulfate transporter [Neospora caninum Liverpool]CBZ53547.1 putative sulfate transporter [Neospora caninum Liverpool]|eukprot:XP_003883579.1 putative sulfate transporter [Neospora caninum Liverpool]